MRRLEYRTKVFQANKNTDYLMERSRSVLLDSSVFHSSYFVNLDIIMLYEGTR